MQVELYDDQDYLDDRQKNLIYSVLELAAETLDLKDSTEMSVSIVDNDRIQEINRQYRDKDAPTDVISFAIEDETPGDFSLDFEAFDIPRQLGDIFISYEQAQAQAEDYGHSLKRELGFLAVHGFLHLNGYDHMTPEDEEEMFSLQDQILEAFGLER